MIARHRHVVSSAVGVALLMTLGGCSAPQNGSSTGSSGPSEEVVPIQSSEAAAALHALPVRQADPMTGYDRDELFGPKWSDDVDVPSGHNGCDQRSDALRRGLIDVQLKPGSHGCAPVSGTLHDPYTGRLIAFVRGPDTSDDVQIDHVVALANAWRTGAQEMTDQERRNLAGDPLNLLAVDGPTNRAKGDSDASQWLPPDPAAHCTYVARQVAVKTRYRLWLTSAEKDSMSAVLAGCPDQPLPTQDSPDVGIPALSG